MKHITALAIKTTLIFLLLSIVLSLFNDYAVWNVLGLSVILVIAAYILGDLIILRLSNNFISTVVDIGICSLLIWLISPLVLQQSVPLSLALLSAFFIGVGESVFHVYMARTVFRENKRVYS